MPGKTRLFSFVFQSLGVEIVLR